MKSRYLIILAALGTIACFAGGDPAETADPIDPASVWIIQPVSATIAGNNNGSAWDSDSSAPDVFAELNCPGGSTGKTQVVESLNPTWTTGACSGRASDLLSAGFTFALWDEDIASNDTVTALLSFKPTEDDLREGTVTLEGSGGMESVRFSLRQQ